MRLPLYLEKGGSLDTKPNAWSGEDCARFLADHFEAEPKDGDQFIMRRTFTRANVLEITGVLKKFGFAVPCRYNTGKQEQWFQISERGAEAAKPLVLIRLYKEL